MKVSRRGFIIGAASLVVVASIPVRQTVFINETLHFYGTLRPETTHYGHKYVNCEMVFHIPKDQHIVYYDRFGGGRIHLEDCYLRRSCV